MFGWSWWLETASLATALTVAIGILIRWQKPSPSARHLLWLVVLVTMITPSLGVWPWTQTSTFDDPRMTHPPEVADVLPPVDLESELTATFENPSQREVSSPPPASFESSWLGWNRERAQDVAVVLFVCGTSFLLLLHLVRTARLIGALRRAGKAPKPLVDLVQSQAFKMGVKAPSLHVVDELSSPCVVFLGKAALLIPSRSLSVEDSILKAIVVHELTHLRRRDHWIGWLETLGLMLWWWFPVFWWVRYQLRSHAELACDSSVVSNYPETRRAYAEALIDGVQARPKGVALWALLSFANLDEREFKRRLTMIMCGEGRSRVRGRDALVALLLFALALPAWSAVEGDSEVQGEGEPSVLETSSSEGVVADGDSQWKLVTEKSVALGEGTQALKVVTGSGGVEVRTGEGRRARIVATVRAQKKHVTREAFGDGFDDHVGIETQGSTLSLSDKHQEDTGKGWSVHLVIELPRALSLNVHSGAGCVTIQAAKGDVALSTSAGSIQALLERHELGSFSAETGAGTIEAKLGTVRGGLSVVAEAGNLNVSLSKASVKESAKIRTQAGNIVVNLPSNLAPMVSAETRAGNIAIDNGLEIVVTERFVQSKASGKGPNKIGVSTEAGNIALKNTLKAEVF